MIIYESNKNWLRDVGHLYKSWTMQKVIRSTLYVAAATTVICVFYKEVFGWSEGNLNITIFSLLGVVLSILLSFRTNSAYDRWWEGRKKWGELVNNSRNLAVYLHSALPKEDEDNRHYLAVGISNFAIALKEHLREKQYFGKDSFLIEIDGGKHIPNQVATSIVSRIFTLQTLGKISQEQLIILTADTGQLTDICGGCERIRNTPIPYSYSAFIKKFIFIYVLTLPIGWVFSLGYFVVPIVPFILYVLASLELIAEEIENPFGEDANDLPVDIICNNIEKHVSEILS